MRPQCVHVYTLACNEYECEREHSVHMYARVYKSTHYGRKGHLARFCFDRLNSKIFSNNNVWVPYDANPRGPKKKWASKSPPFCV